MATYSRASIASAGNDHRLGANEAPPAIISVYTGSVLEQILNDFWTQGLMPESEYKMEELDLGLTKIPRIPKDQTDRNRTSPFPFTDNRFEFRAVGASAHCAACSTVLNTIVADQLTSFKNEVDKLTTTNADMARQILFRYCEGYRDAVKRIVFNGNGYLADWEDEAAKRGLSDDRTHPPHCGHFCPTKQKRFLQDRAFLMLQKLKAVAMYSMRTTSTK